jgi:branched-chain amino acid transport system ATP-binding protein
MSEVMLRTDGLMKRFGGVLATDNVSLTVPQSELHAVIGPNGAGKTTLLAQLAGEIRSDSGTIFFANEDVTKLPTYARAARGIGRSFQINSIFRDFTALQNVAIAVQVRSGHSFNVWRQVRNDKALQEEALALLTRVGLEQRAGVPAERLAHGEKRALELAIALAMRPKMLLLDEPTAGMGPDESSRIVQLLKALKGQVTILLIEHDMDAVFALADQITVLVYGRVIATDTPDAIRRHDEVRRAYLGEDAD